MNKREVKVISNERIKFMDEIVIIDCDKRYSKGIEEIKDEIWYLRLINAGESEYSTKNLALKTKGTIEKFITKEVEEETKKLKSILEGYSYITFQDKYGNEIKEIKDFINNKEFVCYLKIGDLGVNEKRKYYMNKILEGELKIKNEKLIFANKNIEEMTDKIEKIKKEWELGEKPLLNIYFSTTNKGKKIDLESKEIKKILGFLKRKSGKTEIETVIEITESENGVELFFKINNREINILRTKKETIIIELEGEKKKIEVEIGNGEERLKKMMKEIIEKNEVENLWNLLY